ncbi:4-alpha-glucanotransferase [Sphingomonas sp. RP10(2022)]|uniref:4-alpha-glucanotransferase n=1 Tax=Sphingomonas liriopis TaxID=2949094 RepID=A0A9X2KTC7_9SPHN|nr:4-alpha-glucanotransferase [Sphingomonas liriopis]MCP3734758.1 4-alpha-glucanotransferase [Sphingomonas liriopis]
MTDLTTEAAAAGLQIEWEDAEGRPHRVDAAVLRAVLDTLDTRIDGVPFVTGDVGRPVAASAAAGPAQLILEDGTTRTIMIGPDGTIPPIAEAGYHRLDTAAGVIDLAIAPLRCVAPPPGHGWGPAVQVPALRGSRPTPYGDLGTLAEAARDFARAGADVLAISPTHALFPADAARFSPYAPSSRLFHHALLADPGLAGVAGTAEDGGALIDWQRAWPERLAQLRAAFDQAPTDLLARFDAARAGRPDWDEHARFDALHAHFFAADGACGWQDWPADYHDPAGAAVARFVADHAREVAFHAFLQWLADASLAQAQAAARDAGMRIGLIADLAVGMDAGGSHAWSRRGDLLTGLSIGAPPDPLGPQGQNWGITALSPFALRRTGFDGFIRTVRAALCHAGGVRIDHALGLQRLWVIPDGGRASDGAYLAMPFADLLRILALESHRANAIVIGEDLGTVPPGFRDAMAAKGMLGMRVLPFERDDTGFIPATDWDAAAVAMTGTHDTATLAGWWTGRDITWNHKLKRSSGDEPSDRLCRIGERKALWTACETAGVADGPLPNDAAPAIDAAIAFTARAPCPLTIVPLEDLVGIAEQPNLPGTTDEHPNWRRRMPDTTEALLARPEVARRAVILSAKSQA